MKICWECLKYMCKNNINIPTAYKPAVERLVDTYPICIKCDKNNERENFDDCDNCYSYIKKENLTICRVCNSTLCMRCIENKCAICASDG